MGTCEPRRAWSASWSEKNLVGSARTHLRALNRPTNVAASPQPIGDDTLAVGQELL